MNIQYIEVPGYRGETDIKICHTVIGNQEAEFARAMMKHLAIGTADIDGEDSAGRQKCRLMTPSEIVQRACDISQAAFAEFEKRGWMLAVPLPKPPKSKDEL